MRCIPKLAAIGFLAFVALASTAGKSEAQMPGGPPAVAASGHLFIVDSIYPNTRITWNATFLNFADASNAVAREVRFVPRKNVSYQIHYIRTGPTGGVLWSSGIIPGQ